jgi:hypothetical protein|tara:strand:- start:48 stop:416 length:369 start_codon:yes stop_codon:yes gene_type:complete
LNIYTEFKATPAGSELSKEEFLRLPTKAIYEVIRLAGDRDKRMANIYSISTARLTAIIIGIAQSFGGSKSNAKPPEIDKLLPFPLDPEHARSMDETNEVFKTLIKNRKLPIHVIASLKKLIG